MKIVGFSFLRNAVKFDYPFAESLASLAPLCDEIVLAVGKSEDDTLARLRALELPCPLRIVETVWNEANRKSGLVLSEETNIALAEVRRRHPEGVWAFYLQGDELLNEIEHARIRADLAEAELAGASAVRFRYLHFWLRPDRIAIGRRWYPQEIRAIRSNSDFASYGDAQSFREKNPASGQAIFAESDAFIYHYGHVREPAAYEAKKKDFHRWWHGDKEIAGVLAKGEANDAREKCLAYFGPHPRAIEARLKRLFGDFVPAKKPEVVLYGSSADFSEKFRYGIGAEKVKWTEEAASLAHAVPLAPIPFGVKLRSLFRHRPLAPSAMESPIARPFTKDFRALLELSARAIPCSSAGL